MIFKPLKNLDCLSVLAGVWCLEYGIRVSLFVKHPYSLISLCHRVFWNLLVKKAITNDSCWFNITNPISNKHSKTLFAGSFAVVHP